MNRNPDFSPWGEIQDSDTLCPGIFLVTTASHGGTMVSRESEAYLSPAARKCGIREGDFLCFEEDSDEHVVLRELLDRKLWNIPTDVKDPAQFEETLNRSIQEYHPEYWAAREKHRKREAAPRKQPARKENVR